MFRQAAIFHLRIRNVESRSGVGRFVGAGNISDRLGHCSGVYGQVTIEIYHQTHVEQVPTSLTNQRLVFDMINQSEMSI